MRALLITRKKSGMNLKKVLTRNSVRIGLAGTSKNEIIEELVGEIVDEYETDEPAPLVRIKRRWRWHVMFRGASKKTVDRITRYAARRAPHTDSGQIRVVFDRDPVSVL